LSTYIQNLELLDASYLNNIVRFESAVWE